MTKDGERDPWTGACFLTGGPARIIVVDGVEQLFEDHPRLGPCPVTKTGKERHLAPRHRFWHAVTQWYQSGKALSADGRCVRGEPEDSTEGMVQVGKRTFMPREMFERITEKLAANKTKRTPVDRSRRGSRVPR